MEWVNVNFKGLGILQVVLWIILDCYFLLSTGAQLLFKFKNQSSFKINYFKQKVRDVVFLFATQRKLVDCHVSRSFHDTIQVVLVEQGQYEGYVEELAGLILNMVESGNQWNLSLIIRTHG